MSSRHQTNDQPHSPVTTPPTQCVEWIRQHFATSRSFLICYGLLGTIQSMAVMYFNVTLTTIERRFGLPSGRTGLALSGNEISQILLSLVLAHIGGRQHRPRWLAAGSIVSAVSCLILAAPHFIYGAGNEALHLTYEYEAEHGLGASVSDLWNSTLATDTASGRSYLCSSNRLLDRIDDTATTTAPTDCKSDSGASNDVLPLYLIFASQFVLGIGTTMFYTLGTTYMDDGVAKRNTPKTLAYAFSFRMLGHIAGYGLVHVSLNMYIDPWRTPSIQPNDPRWLGAWWFGWLVLGVSMLLVALLVGMFPRELPRKSDDARDTVYSAIPDAEDEGRSECFTMVENGTSQTHTDANGNGGGSFVDVLMRLLRNKLIMYNYAANVFYLLGSSANFTYFAKYLEVQFNRDPTNGTIISGPINIAGTISGFLLAGWLIGRYRPAPRWLFAWNLIVGVLCIGGVFVNMLLECDPGSMLGSVDALAKLTDGCNAKCECEALGSLSYSPVCDVGTGTTFFSPCHAGCRRWDAARMRYDECGCGETDGADPIGMMLPGACTEGCVWAFTVFTVVLCISNWLGASARIGNMMLSFRAVPVADKSFAQGFALWTMSLLALIPGPILSGYIIDSTCLIWNTSLCDDTVAGNCLLYDQWQFRWSLNGVTIAFMAVGVGFDWLVWLHGKNVDMYGPDDDAIQVTTSFKKNQL